MTAKVKQTIIDISRDICPARMLCARHAEASHSMCQAESLDTMRTDGYRNVEAILGRQKEHWHWRSEP